MFSVSVSGVVVPVMRDRFLRGDEAPVCVPSSDLTLRAWPAASRADLHALSDPIQEDREARGSVSRSDLKGPSLVVLCEPSPATGEGGEFCVRSSGLPHLVVRF